MYQLLMLVVFSNLLVGCTIKVEVTHKPPPITFDEWLDDTRAHTEALERDIERMQKDSRAMNSMLNKKESK